MILPRAYFVVNVRYLIVGMKYILMRLEFAVLHNLARPKSFGKNLPKTFLIVGLNAVKRLSCFCHRLLKHCANVQNATNNSLVFKFCLCYDLLKAFR